jgi:hypothetical protein
MAQRARERPQQPFLKSVQIPLEVSRDSTLAEALQTPLTPRTSESHKEWLRKGQTDPLPNFGILVGPEDANTLRPPDADRRIAATVE